MKKSEKQLKKMAQSAADKLKNFHEDIRDNMKFKNESLSKVYECIGYLEAFAQR